MIKMPGSRLIRNSLFDSTNKVVLHVFGWAISIWIARQLGPHNYGIFTMVLWVNGTVSWIIGMGFFHAITKFIAEYHGKGDQETVAAIVRFIAKIEILLTLGSTLLLFLFTTPIADYFFSPSESLYFFLAFIGLLPGVLTAIFSATIEGIMKFQYFVYSNLILTPLSFAAKIGVLLLGMGIEGLLLVMVVFSFINAGFYAYVLHRERIRVLAIRQKIADQLRRRILKYNFNVVLITLCDKIVWDRSENFFLGRFCNALQLGYYNLGFNIVQKFMNLLPTTFWRILFPAMSGYCGAGEGDKTKRVFFVTTRYLAFASFPIGVAGAILSHDLVFYLYGSAYLQAERIVQILFLSTVVTSIGVPGSAVLYGYEKQSFIYKLGAVMAVFNVVMDIIFIRQYGALGAAWCYALTTVTGSVLGTLYTCRVMKLKYPTAALFKILVSTVIMAVSMKLIILHHRDPFFVSASAVIGLLVYCTCSLILGTFEKEDHALLHHIKTFLPEPLARLMEKTIRIIMEFKKRMPSYFN